MISGYLLNEGITPKLVTHQSVQIKALPAQEQHQAVDAVVKGLGAGEAGQELVAIDGQRIPVVVHHSDQQVCPDPCLRCPVRDAVDRSFGLQNHLAIGHILQPQVDAHARIGLLQAAPGLHPAGTYCQVAWRIAVLQEIQVAQLGVRQQGQDIVVNVLGGNGEYLGKIINPT